MQGELPATGTRISPRIMRSIVVQPAKELIKLHRLPFSFLKVHTLQAANVTKFEPFILIYDVEERNEAPELNVALSVWVRLLRHESQSILANRVKLQMRYM